MDNLLQKKNRFLYKITSFILIILSDLRILKIFSYLSCGNIKYPPWTSIILVLA